MSSGSRKNVSRTIGGSSGDVLLQRTRFRRLEEESLSGTNNAQHWENAEATREEDPSITGVHGSSVDRPNAIMVRHEYDLSTETRQQVTILVLLDGQIPALVESQIFDLL